MTCFPSSGTQFAKDLLDRHCFGDRTIAAPSYTPPPPGPPRWRKIARQDVQDVAGILTFTALMAAILGSCWLWH